MFFQLQTKELIETGLTITPGSATAYGALVVALCAAVIALWRKLFVVENNFQEVTNKSVQLLTKVSQRLDDQQQHIEIIKDLKNEINHLNNLIANLSK